VFAVVVFSTIDALCYIQSHHTAVVNGVLNSAAPAGAAPDFQLQPSPGTLDPQVLRAFAKAGAFRGRTIGVIASSADEEELNADTLPALKKLHVKVVQTAVDDAPAGDQLQAVQKQALIAQKFKSEGVNLVIGVGQGTGTWEIGNETNQSSYNPQVIATGFFEATALIGNATENDPTYLKTLSTATPVLPLATHWNTPAVQACVKTIRKAYPQDAISKPPPNTTNSNAQAPDVACQVMAFFVAAAKAAGKNLTNASFTAAGESLRDLAVPGVGPVSFGPRQETATVPIYFQHYDVASKAMVASSTPAAT
jgi:hypothetical protein